MEVQSQINENTVISPQERQEFDEFKRQKRVAEARAIISRIELSFTAPSADRATLRRLLKDGEKAGLGGVCVTPYLVKPCSDFLGTASALSVAAAISAWGGSDTTDIKVRQVKRAIRDGADAVEVAAPLSAVKRAVGDTSSASSKAEIGGEEGDPAHKSRSSPSHLAGTHKTVLACGRVRNSVLAHCGRCFRQRRRRGGFEADKGGGKRQGSHQGRRSRYPRAYGNPA